MRFKGPLFLAFIFLFSISVSAQNFEGTLTYVTGFDYEKLAKKYGSTPEQLKIQLESNTKGWVDTVKMITKNSKYKALRLSTPVSYDIYLPDSNKLYTFTEGSDECLEIDLSYAYEEQAYPAAPIVYKLDSIAIVNGIKCDIIRVEFNEKHQQYNDFYYNKEVNPISPKFYKKYVFDGRGGFLSLSGALAIKIVKSFEGDDFTLTLVDTKLHKISDDLFLLPKLKPKYEYAPVPEGEEDLYDNSPPFKRTLKIIK